MQTSVTRDPGRLRGWRPPGLLILVGVLVLGLSSSVGAFRWRAAGLVPVVEIEAAGPDSAPEQRLRLWFERYGRAQIHHQLMAYADARGRLVTHIEQPPETPGEDWAPELWGIDLSRSDERITSLEGLTVVVRLPRPAALERTVEIPGSVARSVPIYRPGESPAPLEDLARARVQGYLSPILTSLQRKLPEAGLRLELD